MRALRTRVGIATAGCLLAFASTAAALTIIGTPGDDHIIGSSGPDRIAARAGNDTVRALGSDDRVKAGPGDDRVAAGVGADALIGGSGDDRLWALARADVPVEGVDSVDGGPGDDAIHTRDGEADNVTCGEGDHDRARLDNVDVITDATAENPNGSCERVDRADPTGGETEPS
jgi:Ca2+-binding RTX toxin-like protein